MNKPKNTVLPPAARPKLASGSKVAQPAKPTPQTSTSPAPKAVTRRGPYKYDICLSFAGENRAYVNNVAKCLKNRGVAVFYDMDEKAVLWGKNLVDHFGELYEKKARYCVMFISEHYAKKLWTTFERRSAQARAFRSKKEYILPAYFDDTRLPGIPKTVADVDLKKHTPLQLSKVIIAKLKSDQPDRVFKLPSETALARPVPRAVSRKPHKPVKKSGI